MFGRIQLGTWGTRGVHRAPRPREWWQRPGTAKVAMAAVRTAALALLAVLAIALGAVLAVHGPSDDTPAPAAPPVAAPPPEATAPQEPPRSPRPGLPKRPTTPGKPGKPPVRPGGAQERPRSVVLVPGDTLSALAGRHDTTVRALQRLNGLGSSTLIYAGDTLLLAPGTTPPAPGGGDGDGDGDGDGAPSPGKAPAPGKGSSAAIGYAKAQLGKPYVWGGTGPRGYDCSGLVMRAWEAAGVALPRTTWDQVRAGRATTRSGLAPGDLVITANGGHIQLYIGDGKVIHAPRTGSDITVAPLPSPTSVLAYRHITA
ncbi:C40 family peptidase [Streptomyces sp. SP18CS02]|uniref:C40 family peptidase n=1 Tax=Streptomyces sp. SP18CS02 TaxID=3002531 RepID=UPI002E7760AC|nr:NlpC/P60 family protein [Streptomyces sp. SP18CS02]MEE1755597.1 NlpC/P60 family protein [Streptomyces sp. SP18CS02]